MMTQAGHGGQTPFEQARDYDTNRPLREKARWIVVCNFDEIRIHDMEADVPETAFERISLGRLVNEVQRLKFLVHAENAIRARELEVSVKAGRVVGKLYGAFLDDYAERGGPTSVSAADATERVPPNPCNPRNPWFEKISQTAQAILDARALYPDSSLADLYDPLTMPPELRKAHAANDAAVLAAYGFPPDLDESAIVSRLFEMYAKMVSRHPWRAN